MPHINSISKVGLTLCLAITVACSTEKKKETTATATIETEAPFFKLSLAQWSLHKTFLQDSVDPFLFAEKANAMGFEGVEYVNHLYNRFLDTIENKEEAMKLLIEKLNAEASKNNVKNLLIMIDGEGDLASEDLKQRDEAVEKHKKWVDAAAALGCHSIRVNLFGATEPEAWKTAAIDGLTKLSDYAATKNINVIVENHGYLSSNGKLLVEVIKAVNKPNCGTLPDFGNFCLKREGGKLWDAPCVEEYDRYKGVTELMPYAKAVSAKSYAFDSLGNETKIDYSKMLRIVKDAGYTGFIGVEYEGEIPEEEGILATKDLLLKVAQNMGQ